MKRYYFDYNATAPIAPEVMDAMLPVMRDVYGNASSIHHFGQAARRQLDASRKHIAAFLGAHPEEIIFTSGATEADNLALMGLTQNGHIVTTAIEHPAVLATARALGDVTIVPVDGRGVVDPDDVRRAIRPTTTLISVMHANNELGTVQPVAQIAHIALEAGILLHSDGVQAAGRIPVNVAELGVTSYAISGHKLAGPKGVGALYLRKGTELRPAIHGGPQERGRRGGTENIAAAAGFAVACQRTASDLAVLRDLLERSILERIMDAHVNGAGVSRIPNTTNIRFDGIDSDALLIALDLRGFAVSSGAACSSGATEPSHVLLAIGLSKLEARSSIRFSLGYGNTAEQIELLVQALVESVAHLRKLSPVYA